ncbi:hypothetical protein KEJ50_05825 [Candidatus Bathyarchaeota archaeon]|nr:hypothetical protein [Candidatus Bathyarchaeota archaeon]
MEASSIINEEWISIASEVSNMIKQSSLIELYEKVREATSPEYRSILTLLEGFERFSKSLDKEPKILSHIIKELELKARKE